MMENIGYKKKVYSNLQIRLSQENVVALRWYIQQHELEDFNGNPLTINKALKNIILNEIESTVVPYMKEQGMTIEKIREDQKTDLAQ